MRTTQIYPLLVLSFLALVTPVGAQNLPSPKISHGMTTLTGKIRGTIPGNQQTQSIKLTVSSPVAYFSSYTIPIREDGTFSLNIPVFSITPGIIRSPLYTGRVYLRPGEETKLEITFDESGKKQIDIRSSLDLTTSDMINMSDVLTDILMNGPKIKGRGDYNMKPDDFIQYCMEYLEAAKKRVQETKELSESAKLILYKELTTFYLEMHFFDYKNTMKRFYIEKEHPGEDKSYDQINFEPPPLEKSYYSFLREFNLNDPYYLYSSYYQRFISALLNDEILAIPAIGDQPPGIWLQKVKEVLKDLLGSDKGLFYKILVANAYVQQLDDLIVLTSTQKENIKSYFKDEAFADFLLDENGKTIRLIAGNRKSDRLTINKTPAVAKEEIMTAIVQKYSGKVVFIDFWATWCSPCLQAMAKSAPVKKEFEGKEVVFVYITTTSSPPKIWEQYIQKIGGEHYYLASEIWAYILDDLGFSGIPAYFVYDKNGLLKHRSISFMGVDDMRNWINGLL